MPDLLALYDHDERYSATYPDTRRDALPRVVRHIDLLNRAGVVLYSNLTAETADSVIQQQINFFQSIDQDFEWKVFAHDQPADLVQRLASLGFHIDDAEAVLVLDLASAQTPELDVDVKRLLDPAELGDVLTIKRLADRKDHVDRLAYEMTHAPESIWVYVAYVDGTPAACAWVRFPEQSAFASLWGGTTVPELRRHGLYTALLHARIKAAQRRQYHYLTVDAGPMSRPILEKRGFQLLTHATACTWSAHS